jgi:hypothetical protein
MLPVEEDRDFLEPHVGKAKIVSRSRVPKTKSLELGRKIGAVMASNIVRDSRIIGAKFGDATGKIKVGSIAKSSGFEPEGKGLPPG